MLKRRLVTCGIAVSGLAVALGAMLFGVPGRGHVPGAFAELVHQGTPTTGSPLHVALDCDLDTAGTQDHCARWYGNSTIDLAITVGNSSGADVLLGAFNFHVVANVPTSYETFIPDAGSPYLNGAVVGPPFYICDNPPPSPDLDPDPSIVDSFLSCVNGTGPYSSIPTGPSHTTLATIHYNAVAMPVDSRVTFSLQNTEAADDNAVVVVSCYDVSLPGYNCYGADVVFQHFFPTPTFTPTPTATPLPDSDGDGVPDTYDNCPNAANPGQENRDANFIDLHVYGKLFDDTTRVMSDAFGDACDPDDTFPGTSCPSGQPASTYMTHEDTDGDRVIDSAECAMGTNPDDALSYPPPMPAGDADHDALPDVWETAHGTDPANPDTDGDRLLDGVEVLYYGSSPRIADTDGDGCSDGKEAASLNNDLTVNSTDQLMVAQTFSNAGSTKYVVDFDVNKDGRINSTDMLVQAKAYGPC